MGNNIQRGIFALITVLLYASIWYMSEAKAQLILYKVSLISIAAMLGYWIDLLLFKRFRPSDMYHEMNTLLNSIQSGISNNTRDAKTLEHDLVYLSRSIPFAFMRRAVIIFACIIGISVGI